MSKRPIQMMSLHGTHKLWHANEDIGMTVTGRDVSLQVYHHEDHDDDTTEASVASTGRRYESPDEFLATFEAVVGEFATKGEDLHDDELKAWLDGSKWKEIKKQQQQQQQQQQRKDDDEEEENRKQEKEKQMVSDTTTTPATAASKN
jgi:hypothetical protein